MHITKLPHRVTTPNTVPLRLAAIVLLVLTTIGCGQLVHVERDLPKEDEPAGRPTPLAGPGPDSREADNGLAVNRMPSQPEARTAFRHPVEAVGQTSQPEHTEQQKEAIASAEVVSRSFREASRLVLPSVVTIQRTAPGRSGGPSDDASLDDFLNRFFGDMETLPNRRQVSLGSGVIIDKTGIILTNAHVVGNGQGTIVVRLHDGRKFEAVDVKTDPKTDLAVLRIRGAGHLPAASLGNSDNLQIGDWVIAVGNPFGLSETVTAGIISAKGRGLGITEQEGFLQTDAAINPGNSGGPLVNLRGQVVGIATAISTTTGGYQGIGFAIPINVARWVSEQLITKGEVTRAYLGVGIAELNPDLASELGLDKQTSGVVVTQVYPDSPADKAGLKRGDVIVEFAGRRITSPPEVQDAVQQSPIGSEQRLTAIRNGKRINLDVVVQEQPKESARAERQPTQRP